MKLRGMTSFQILKDASVKRYKAINSDGISSVHAQSVVLVSKHDLYKALSEFPRYMEDHAIADFTPYFALCFIVQSILYRKRPQNWRFSFCGQSVGEKHEVSLDRKIIIDNIWPYIFAFHGLFYNCAKFYLSITKCSVMVIFLHQSAPLKLTWRCMNRKKFSVVFQELHRLAVFTL